ncbi:MAG: hypothetical protein K6U08_06635 [Firmicutes bacterium]|nr:hypothetical protein [Bacillota bacterium]
MRRRPVLPKPRPRLVERTGVPEVDDLRERIVDLEARVRALALSRRVLMNLLVTADRQRRTEVARLRQEVETLQQRNLRRARALAARDAVIHRLRYRLTLLQGEQEGPPHEGERLAGRSSSPPA